MQRKFAMITLNSYVTMVLIRISALDRSLFEAVSLHLSVFSYVHTWRMSVRLRAGNSAGQKTRSKAANMAENHCCFFQTIHSHRAEVGISMNKVPPT